MRNQKGFTLIELVVVIVILGILAAVAVPKFVDMQVEARTSAINGMLGAVQSASAIAHAQALVTGATGPTNTITMEGDIIDVVYGYPTSAATANGNISDTINSDGFTYTAAAIGNFALDADGSTADCWVRYQAPTAPNTAPQITVDDSCD